jgi:hypothetical protein
MKETYSERTILLKLKQMEKIQIKTMEILHRIEKLLDLEEEVEQKKPFQDKPPFYYHPDKR